MDVDIYVKYILEKRLEVELPPYHLINHFYNKGFDKINLINKLFLARIIHGP